MLSYIFINRMINQESFKRVELLLGSEDLTKIEKSKVIVFGVGGVGSWCAEALVRTGITNITLVDFDVVCVTNINRQLMATNSTIGLKKVEVLKERLLDINPLANVVIRQEIFSADNAKSFNLGEFDYIIDAIDSLDNKVKLIQMSCETEATLFSSMGAALKLDPTRVKVAEFWKVNTCSLAASLRRKFRKLEKPTRKFLCVYSDEKLENKGKSIASDIVGTDIDSSGLADHTLAKKGMPNGTVVFVTAAFGLTLASLVINHIIQKNNEPI